MLATQSPADIDYKALGQVSTWAIGRIVTTQDLVRLKPMLDSIAGDYADDIMAALPTKQACEFTLLSPDVFKEPIEFKTRWLYTEHKTLDEDAVRTVMQGRYPGITWDTEAQQEPTSQAPRTAMKPIDGQIPLIEYIGLAFMVKAKADYLGKGTRAYATLHEIWDESDGDSRAALKQIVTGWYDER